MPHTALIPTLLVILGGLFFSLIAIAYKVGDTRGVPTLHIALQIAAGGGLYFGLLAEPQWGSGVPWVVWGLGVGTGLSQFACVLLIRYALARGPLSPMWCAACLGFLPAVVYSMVWLHEPGGWLQVAGVLAGVGCVLVSAFDAGGQGNRQAHQPPPTMATRLRYAGALALLLLCNSTPNLAMKYLGTLPLPGNPAHTYFDGYQRIFFCTLYLAIVGAVLVYLALARPGPPLRRRVTLGLGVLATVGSIGGLSCIGYTTALLPGAVVFTASSIASILAAALVSVFALGERRSAVWYASVTLALAAVVLVSWPAPNPAQKLARLDQELRQVALAAGPTPPLSWWQQQASRLADAHPAFGFLRPTPPWHPMEQQIALLDQIAAQGSQAVPYLFKAFSIPHQYDDYEWEIEDLLKEKCRAYPALFSAIMLDPLQDETTRWRAVHAVRSARQMYCLPALTAVLNNPAESQDLRLQVVWALPNRAPAAGGDPAFTPAAAAALSPGVVALLHESLTVHELLVVVPLARYGKMAAAAPFLAGLLASTETDGERLEADGSWTPVRVSDEAYAALQDITGLHLPPDPAAWRAAVGPDPLPVGPRRNPDGSLPAAAP